MLAAISWSILHILTPLIQSALNEDAAQLQARLDGLVEQIDEVKSRESQLRTTNKVRGS